MLIDPILPANGSLRREGCAPHCFAVLQLGPDPGPGLHSAAHRLLHIPAIHLPPSFLLCRTVIALWLPAAGPHMGRVAMQYPE